jgi:large subunit ribosomal protein L13
MNKTYTPRAEEIDRRWYVVDATDETLGRLASRIAKVLEGKHKPTYASHIDAGDHVIVLNASRISVTGNKREEKVYVRHSGYPQGLREETLGQLLERRPEEAIRRAVRGMLPRNRLGVQQLRKLKVYAGAQHPHEAQQPQPLESAGAPGASNSNRDPNVSPDASSNGEATTTSDTNTSEDE